VSSPSIKFISGTPTNDARDDRDATALYELLENEIVPDFYTHSDAWKQRAIHSFETIPPQFNTDRMVREYTEKYYFV